MLHNDTTIDGLGWGYASLRATALGAMVLLLAACAGVSRNEWPVPIEERTQERAQDAPPAAAGESDAKIAAYRPPARPRYARPVPARAVGVLMRKADDQREQGDLDGASISLERALRIAPRDPVLWHQLAEVRMVQRRHALVVQLAAKSNALTSSRDDRLLRKNWQLIARSRRALGDAPGAREAERRASVHRQ